MNCDTAFDLMTDSHGSRSGALAQHFESCTRCRQMQETLAPALEFLTQDESPQGFSAASGGSAALDSGGRQPFVTVDSIKIAQQAANRLIAQADLPSARRQRLTGEALRYAAVFAAGLLLALILGPDRRVEQPVPAGHCTRQDAAGPSSGRSANAIEVLARSCAACHTSVPASTHDKNTSLFRSDRATSWDWLAPFFYDEYWPSDDPRLVAGSTSPGLHISPETLSDTARGYVV